MTNLASVKIKASAAFDKIGKTNGTAPPASLDNRFQVAWELFISYALESIAKKRKDAAKAAAEQAGILGDSYVEGETKTVYKTDELVIASKTATGAERLDQTKLKNELTKELGLVKALALIEKCKVKSKPATSFEFIQGE